MTFLNLIMVMNYLHDKLIFYSRDKTAMVWQSILQKQKKEEN